MPCCSTLPSPVLVVAPDVLQRLEGDQALSALWCLLNKCKSSVQDGQRLENISWRLWYREMAANHSYRPLTPSSPASELTDVPFVRSGALSKRQPIGKVLYEMLPGSPWKTIQLQIPSAKEKHSSQPSTSGMTHFPRVVVVNPTPNPTPHPTPPATPTPVMSVQFPVAVSLSTPKPTAKLGKLLLPSVHSVQPVSNSGSGTSSNNSTLFLHPLSRCTEPRTTQPPLTSAQASTRSQTQSDPGTGTSSASISRAAQAQAVVSPSSGSSFRPSMKDPHTLVTPSPQLPPSPDPSCSSVCSWTESRTTADTENSISGISATVTTVGNVTRNSRCNNEVTANTNTNHHAPNTGSTILPSSSSGSSSSCRSSGGHGVLPPSDAAATRKFYLSSTTTTPSPASGSSFERRSDVSQMSVSPINDEEGSKQERRIPHPSIYRVASYPKPNLAGPIIETALSQPPLPRTSSDSSGSLHVHLRGAKRVSADSHSQSHHVTRPPSTTSLSSQSNTSRRCNGARSVHSRGASESSRSRSSSRSRNRVVDALTMTSMNVAPAKANDGGGAKPRPRRKGSGDGGGPKVGDRGRYARPQGYGIYQPQSTSQTQAPITQAQQQSKKNMFCVGNQDDDDDWEDDDDDGESSSMSRSRSLSQSRSRSRSGCSRSPSAQGRNMSSGLDQHQSRQSHSPLAQPPIQPSDDLVPQTNGRSTKDSRSPEIQKPSSEGRPEKQLGTVLGPNGRKVVVMATDDDDDDYDDDDDDEDWEEEEEESEEAVAHSKVNMKENVLPKTEKQEQQKEAEVSDGDDEDWTDDEGGGADVEPTVTANATAGTGTTQMSAATHGTNGGSSQGKSNGKRNEPLPPLTKQQPQQSRSSENKPQHYPNPPAPQLLQRAHSSRYVGGTGGLPQPPPVKRTHSQQPQVPPNHHHHNRQSRHPGVDMSQAALEAQRQLELFEKKPKPAWSGLLRTGSGLLSQLMNPDPDIFPVDHPYRFRYSSGDVGMPKGVARLGVAPLTPIGDGKQQPQRVPPLQKEGKKSGISSGAPQVPPAPTNTNASPKVNGRVARSMAPGLKTSKSAVALPVADPVTAASVKDGGLVNGQKNNQPSSTNLAASSGYRPKGKPHDEELEDDTDTEVDGPSSVAQQKLALLAGKRKQHQPQKSSTLIRPDFFSRAATDTCVEVVNPTPIQIQRTQSQYVPGATATTIAPLPLGYPYNLPPAAPPSSPRTTRQLMLRKEMSESVRYNLFWSRQLSRAETSGPRKRSSNEIAVIGHGEVGVVGENNVAVAPAPAVPPPPPTNISAVPNLVHLSAKKKPGRGTLVDAAGNGEPSVQEPGWVGDRPPNPRRRSSAAVSGAGQVQNLDQDFNEVDGQIHVGGGGNLITRTRSWAGLAGGTGGMTRMI